MSATIAVTGFLTFGTQCQGLILNNYDDNDPIMTASRVAVTLSLLSTYPLTFVGFRTGVLDLWWGQQQQQRNHHQHHHQQEHHDAHGGRTFFTLLTMALLALVTCIALYVHDMRLVLALTGATWGTCILYIFPGIMIISLQQRYGDDAVHANVVAVALVTAVLGFFLGVLGTVRALQS